MSGRIRPARACSLLALLSALAGCGGPPAQPAPKPAAPAEKPRVEGELARTTLSKEAAASLGVRSEPARTRRVQGQLVLPGRVMVPQGREVTLTAPVSGYVREPDKGIPLAGMGVERGRVLFLLEPVLSPVERVQMATLERGVQNELAKAKKSVAVAKSEVERVRDLQQKGLRGRQDLEQAEAKLQHAQADLDAARDKLRLFTSSGNGAGGLASWPVRAPRAGTVLSVPVSPGQYVTATAPLMTLADMTRLWLRVPVPESELPRVDRKASALVRPRPGGSGARPRAVAGLAVRPLALVPQVDSGGHTADLIYELPESAPGHGLLAKDQTVSVGVPVDERREETVVPHSAVVYDAHAGAWIYVEKTPAGSDQHVYERRRVELGPTAGEEVVVRPPCASGERVVTSGAGVLFSREFHKPPQK